VLSSSGSSLSIAQQELGQQRFKTALKYAKKAQREAPKSPVPHNLSGIAYSAIGKPVDAVKCFRHALRLKPDFEDARKNLAQTYPLMGQHENALLSLQKVAATPDAFYIKAQAFAALVQKEEALDAAGQYISNAPQDKRGYKLRAFIRLRFGLIADALEDYEKAREIDPQDAETLTLMSLPLARHLRSEDALEVASRAVAIDPNNMAAQLRLAAQYSEMGERNQSIERYRHILSQDPEQANALKSLSELVSGDALVELERPVADALAHVKKGSEDEAYLLFARANIFVGKGDRARSDQDVTRANRFFAKRSPYLAKPERELADQILARFPAPTPVDLDATTDMRPIFVVGLPRSGTTLVEAMLGRNTMVMPLGERGTLGFLLEETLTKGLPFGPSEIEKFRIEDRRLLPLIPEGKTAHVDKMPENYGLIGFLKTIYPESRIVNVCRDPRDIALSMFRANFSGSALNYTYDLRAMAERFNLYARMLVHWHKVFPNQIYDIHYETLVRDIEGEGLKIAKFCNLEWLPEMASPEQTRSQVLTMSANQLRVPVHPKSVGKWKEHHLLLEPFIKGLDPTLWPSVQSV